MTRQEFEENGPIERLLRRVPRPEPSDQFVEAVMRRLPAAPAERPAWVWRPWGFIPRLGLGLAAAVFLAVVLRQQPPAVGTEALLLEGWSHEAAWAFVNESPEADALLGMMEPE